MVLDTKNSTVCVTTVNGFIQADHQRGWAAMSAPSGGASGLSQCACTNISLMQLFHELKQQFPGVPDHVVSNTISTYCHDKTACQTRLQNEVKASLTHAYLASSLAGQRKDKDKIVEVSVRCPNQIAGKVTSPREENCVTSEQFAPDLVNIQVGCETTNLVSEIHCNSVSPNDENGLNKINHESVTLVPAEIPKATSKTEVKLDLEGSTTSSSDDDSDEEFEQIDSQTFQILKSNKIKCNLNEKLNVESISQEVVNSTTNADINQNGKPKRPCTLEFKKEHLPSFDYKLNQEEIKNKITPVDNQAEHTAQRQTEGVRVNTDVSAPSGNWESPGFNVSVNLNCRMDLTPSYNQNLRLGYANDPRLEENLKARGYTSVNLTVCTPTSSVTSPLADEPFEGRVTVTVNPTMGRGLSTAPFRRAPPPPVLMSPLENDAELPEVPAPSAPMTQIETLRCRQRARLLRMRQALVAERARLATAARETALLSAPLPSPRIARRLRTTVAALRQSCQRLAAALDQRPTTNTNAPTPTYNLPTPQEAEQSFYGNIYTGQRVPIHRTAPAPPTGPSCEHAARDHESAFTDDCPSWVCHMCTFRNHGLLNKCEECDMPRILVGTHADIALSESLDSGIATLNLRDVPSIENNMLLTRPNCAMLETSSNSAC